MRCQVGRQADTAERSEATQHSHVNAVAEEIASTANGRRDGDILVSALNDPESRAAGRAYLASLTAARAARA